MRNPPYVGKDGEVVTSIDIGAAIAATKNAADLRQAQRSIDAVNADLNVIPLNKRGAVSQELFDLSGSVAPNIGQVGKVFRVVHALQGSTPGAIVTLDIPGGGLVDLYPGDYFDGPLSEGFQIKRHANSVTSGNARLVLCKQPDAKFGNLAQRAGTGGVLERVTSTQTYNATTNVPTLATDGIAIASDQTLRVLLSGFSMMATAITGGSVRYWFYDNTIGAWFRSMIEYTLPTAAFTIGTVRVVLPDEIIGVPYGRFFPELLSVTADNASATLTATSIVYGN